MFAFTMNANADTTAKESNEEVEVTISDENAAAKASTEEIDEIAVYQRADGSIYVIHQHTVTLAQNK